MDTKRKKPEETNPDQSREAAAQTAKEHPITAAIIAIGDELLSGRTQDTNIAYIAQRLTEIGIQLSEARIIGDDHAEIVSTLNILRHRYTYIFTTGGIGPTHDDITADAVADAFGVSIDYDPRAIAILRKHFTKDGTPALNDARMRMARIPAGAGLIANKISRAPGFCIDNVFVLAGVPAIMQIMFEEVVPNLSTGTRLSSRVVPSPIAEGDLATQLAEIQRNHSNVQIGSYPIMSNEQFSTNLVIRGTDIASLNAAEAELRALVDAASSTLGIKSKDAE